MNKHFLTIMLLSSVMFSQAQAMRPATRLQRKKAKIARRVHRYNTQRERMREQLRRQREERDATKCCGNVNARDVVTVLKGVVTLGITIAKFIIEVAH